MRDFLAATRERVVVFDGGNGRDARAVRPEPGGDYRLPGRCHEALVLNRPDVIEGVHGRCSTRARRSCETDTFQASRLKLDEWGLGDHTLEINRAAQIARKAAGEHRFVAGSIGPTGFLPASDDPTLGQIRSASSSRCSPSRPAACRGRRRTCSSSRPRRTSSSSRPPVFGVREAFKALGPRGADPDQRLAAAQRRQDAAGHRHRRRAGHARGAEGRRHRPQLLHRPRGHARRDPLPRRVRVGAGPLHPQRRPAPAGAQRRDDLPRGARAAGRHARRVRRALRRLDRRRLLRHHAGAHRGDRRPLRHHPTAPARRRARRMSR